MFNFLVIREMQIKAKIRHCFTSPSITKIKKTENSKGWQDVEQLDFHILLVTM